MITPGLQDLRHSLPLGRGSEAQARQGVWGNAGDTLVARTRVLVYFNVVVNKSSRLGVVDYRITKIDGFERGVEESGEASASTGQ